MTNPVYLNRSTAIDAISKIAKFSSDIDKLYLNHDIAINKDVGRKNILLSAAQESFFAAAISENGFPAYVDGRVGEPDITVDVGDSTRELECKVCCKSKTGTWSFQTDERTLEVKGSCDYLYLLFDRKHTSVGALFFSNLNSSDFYPASPGSRGKARMIKSNAFKKCTVLVGDVVDKREHYMTKYYTDLQEGKTAVQKSKAANKLKLWKAKKPQYSITLEPIDEFAS